MDKKRDSFFLKKEKDVNFKQNVGEQKKKRHDESNKNQKDFANIPDKKPFDKKAYRLKKYSKKYKLEQWEEQRKKKLLREFNKDMKNSSPAGTYKSKSFDEDVPDGLPGKYVRHPDLMAKQDSLTKTKKDPYQKAKEQFNRVKQEKLEKQQKIEKIKAEKMQKLEEYKKKKHDKFKKLSKKTKKGQPVMTGRLELLLEKIQNSK